MLALNNVPGKKPEERSKLSSILSGFVSTCVGTNVGIDGVFVESVDTGGAGERIGSSVIEFGLSSVPVTFSILLMHPDIRMVEVRLTSSINRLIFSPNRRIQAR